MLSGWPTMQVLELTMFAAVCYVWGSLSPAQFVSLRAARTDLRRVGSGSVGGSNVGEQLGTAWLVIVGVADILKGAIPVAAARSMAPDTAAPIIAGLAVVAGHDWSIFLGFRGGRGIGATVGATATWDWRLGAVLLLFLVLSRPFRLAPEFTLAGLATLVPITLALGLGPREMTGAVGLFLVAILKRLEANGLPLPRTAQERRAVLWRRLTMDRDVPRNEPWQGRGRFA